MMFTKDNTNLSVFDQIRNDVSSWVRCLTPLLSPGRRVTHIGGGRVILPALSSAPSMSRHDISLVRPVESRQSQTSHNMTDSFDLPIPGFSELVCRINLINSSVISGLLFILMYYVFDINLMRPAFLKKYFSNRITSTVASMRRLLPNKTGGEILI
jgi:hypothetical protein